MLILLIFLAAIGGSLSHTYGNLYTYPGTFNFAQSNGQPMQIHTTTTHQRCCWIKKCKNQVCQESYACGDSCLAPNFQMPGNMQPVQRTFQTNSQPIGGSMSNQQPTTLLSCCIVAQCTDGNCQQVFTCGNQCPKANTNNNNQPKTNPISEPIAPDYQPPVVQPTKLVQPSPADDFKPLPGIYLERTPPASKPAKNDDNKAEKKQSPKNSENKCDNIKYPKDDEDDEDYGPTPGYELKRDYKRNKCNQKTCKMVTVDCTKCPDPFDDHFRLYKVSRECFKCYDFSCSTGKPAPK